MDEDRTDDRPNARERGIAMMKQVYGWDIGDVSGDFVEATVDHLFGDVWANGTMSVRERRLLLIGYLLGSGQHDVVGLQLDCAVDIGELSIEELREIVWFIAHYGGWPIAARMNSQVEDLAAKQAGNAHRDAETTGSPDS
ncbi:MAG TPA: carboxymuconolactone decarboxylase family protein [Acidimicrobiales bacterium]|nr:carboxymuconolactone decarboxylase family protein [Acidimicrobiales bacterium]